jgi:hypothetical protein
MKVTPAFCWWQLLLKIFYCFLEFPTFSSRNIHHMNSPSTVISIQQQIPDPSSIVRWKLKYDGVCGSSVHDNFDCPKCWYLRCYPMPQNAFLSKLTAHFRLLDSNDVNVASIEYDQFSPLQLFVIRREFVAISVLRGFFCASPPLPPVYTSRGFSVRWWEMRVRVLFILGSSVHKIQWTIVVWFVVTGDWRRLFSL